MVPASMGFMVLSRAIISCLFEGGRFNAYSAQVTSSALYFYSIGLFAYGATRIVQCGYFALKDTVTPTKVAAIALVLNVCLISILMFPMKLAGLALATSISGIISFFILFIILRKKLGGLQVRGLLEFSLRILCASVVMAEVCFIASTYRLALHSHLLLRIMNLIVPIASGIIAYVAMCFLLKIEQVRSIGKLFRVRT